MSLDATNLSCRVEPLDDIHVVHVEGSLCDSAISTVRQSILDTLDQGATKIALEMGKIDYISSSGIGMLVSVLKQCRQKEVPFALCGVNAEIRELFSLTRLDQVFPLAKSAAEWQKTIA